METVTVRLGTNVSEEYAHDMYRVLGLIQRKIVTGISIHNGGIGDLHISYTFLDPFLILLEYTVTEREKIGRHFKFQDQCVILLKHKICKKPAQTGKAQ